MINRTNDAALPTHIVERLSELEESVEEILKIASDGSEHSAAIYQSISQRLMDLHIHANHQQYVASRAVRINRESA